jgi:hypothetical protein
VVAEAEVVMDVVAVVLVQAVVMVEHGAAAALPLVEQILEAVAVDHNQELVAIMAVQVL